MLRLPGAGKIHNVLVTSTFHNPCNHCNEASQLYIYVVTFAEDVHLPVPETRIVRRERIVFLSIFVAFSVGCFYAELSCGSSVFRWWEALRSTLILERF